MKKTFLECARLFLYGILAALPLLVGELALFSFVLWIPFYRFLKRALHGEGVRLRTAYRHGLCFFQGYFMAAFSFFIAMYPLDFAGLSSLEAVAVLFAAMVLLPLLQSSVFSLSMLPLGFLAQKRLFRFPCAYALFFSSLSTLFFHLQNFTWMGVPWASPAVGLTEYPIFIQTASLFGSGFLVFLMLLVNALLADAWDAWRDCQDKNAIFSFALAIAIFLTNLGVGGILLERTNEKTGTVKVALLQGCSPISEGYTQALTVRSYTYLARMAIKKDPDIDLMLWAESVLHYSLESDEQMQALFSDIAVQTGAIQIIGSFSAPEDEPDAYYNSLFVFYPDGTVSDEVYNKRRPVPFGEYLPWPELFGALIPALTQISMLSRDTDAGDGTNLFHLPYGTAGGLICFYSIYPVLARESVKDGAELLLVATNDTWFDGSFAKELHLSHAVLRAVENGRTVARTGNTGISAIIDEKGRIVDTVAIDQTDHLTAEVCFTASDTLYTVIGDAFVHLCFCYLAAVTTVVLLPRSRKKKK
jgi:apolipoprotein N-acyltransferase